MEDNVVSDMATHIFDVLDESTQVDWDQNPRCTGLLLRAVYALIEADGFEHNFAK